MIELSRTTAIRVSLYITRTRRWLGRPEWARVSCHLPFEMALNIIEPWKTDEHRESLRGPLIRALLDHRDRLLAIDPWLAFVQDHCCFTFGGEGRPMPIGALFTLWDSCSSMLGRCPSCGESGFGFAFGGLLAVGGVVGACVGCHVSLWRPIGGLAAVGRIIEPELRHTPFFLKDGRFGGTVGSEGRRLLRELRRLGFNPGAGQ